MPTARSQSTINVSIYWFKIHGSVRMGYLVREESLLKNQKKTTVTVELFKLHLSNMPDSEEPPFPKGLNYKKVITDYLKAMGMYEVL